MAFDPSRHHMHSIRLRGYDYSRAGAYFVTVCTQDRACLFGQVVDGEMRLNDAGRIAQATWDGLPEHYPNVELDAFVAMPNHVHGIIVMIDDPVGAGSPRPCRSFTETAMGAETAPLPARQPTLGQMVAYFKYQSTKRINAARGMIGVRVWQRNYYEHVIRDDESLDRIRHCIADNPARWAVDRENPLAAAAT